MSWPDWPMLTIFEDGRDMSFDLPAGRADGGRSDTKWTQVGELTLDECEDYFGRVHKAVHLGTPFPRLAVI